jgi:glycosyltransferase involved in cell wall biosynthesis
MLIVRETPPKTLEYIKGNRVFPSLPFVPAKIKVSAVIITHNESRNLRRTLTRLYWCDEIILVDSYSTDDTVEVGQEFGCRVLFKTFEGYGSQKRYAVAQAKNDWVLCIDADEVLSDALIREIGEEFRKGPSCLGYQMPMNLVFLGREFRYGKESQRYFMRLFNRAAGNFNEATVHEKIELKGKIGRMENGILHYSYSSLQQYIDKCSRYTTLSAEGAVKKGKKKSVPAVLFALPYYFFRYYFIERNILNGLEGFYWSVLSAQAHFTKYIKIRELNGCRGAAGGIL